jgi:Flp pilus assembly protein TadG
VGRQATSRGRSDDGAAAVEFALVVGPLVLLLFGIISYGVMLSLRQSLSQAAAEGARAAAVTYVADQKKPEAANAVTAALDGFGVRCEGAALKKGATVVGGCAISEPGACTPAAGVGIQCVTVRLTYDYANHPTVPTLPGLGIAMPDTLTYEAQARVS